MIKRLFLGLASAALVSGCSTLPYFGGWPSKPDDVVGPTVNDVVKHIQCELASLLVGREDHTMSDDDRKAIAEFRDYQYVALSVLTLEVTDTQAFAPNINVVEPYLRAGTSRVVALGGSYGGTQKRVMTMTFTIDLDPNKANENFNEKCKGYVTCADGIVGNLGLREIVLSGVKPRKGFFFENTPKTDNFNKPVPNPVRPAFGSTVEFSIARTIAGGPTFSLTYFKGPAASGNLLSAGKTNKDSLVISFSSAGLRGKMTPQGDLESLLRRPGEASSLDQAVREAQDQLQRMILQRLVPQ